MPIFLAVFLFAAVLCLTGGFGYYYYARPSRLLDQLTNAARSPRTEVQKKSSHPFATILTTIGGLFPVAPQDARVLKQDLVCAGIRSQSSIQVFYGIKLVLAVGFMVGALFVRNHIDKPMLRTLLPLAGGGIVYLLPGLLLDRLIKKRNERVRMALPDVLDLLVVCTEAGLWSGPGNDQCKPRIAHYSWRNER